MTFLKARLHQDDIQDDSCVFNDSRRLSSKIARLHTFFRRSTTKGNWHSYKLPVCTFTSFYRRCITKKFLSSCYLATYLHVIIDKTICHHGCNLEIQDDSFSLQEAKS